MKGMVPVLVGFGRALRSRGLAVGPGDVATYCAAAATLDPTDLADLYWTGRTTLVSRRDDLAAFDEVFHQYFLGGRRPVDELLRLTARVSTEAESTLEVPLADEPGRGGRRRAGHHGTRRLGRRRAAPPRVRRLHARRAARRAPHHREAPAGPAAAADPSVAAVGPRAPSRPAPHRAGDPAPARRARATAVAGAPGPAAPAGPDPRRLRLDGRPLPCAAAVRLVGAAGRRQGGGVLLRHPTHPHHARAAAPHPGSRARRRGGAGRSTGTAAPASGRRSTGSCARRAAAVWPAAAWW